MRSVLIFFSLRPEEAAAINNGICERSITCTFDALIDSFNVRGFTKVLRSSTTQSLIFFSRSLRKDSAVRGRWKPKKWNEQRRHARRRNRHKSSTLCALKQQGMICRLFNPEKEISFSEIPGRKISMYARAWTSRESSLMNYIRLEFS